MQQRPEERGGGAVQPAEVPADAPPAGRGLARRRTGHAKDARMFTRWTLLGTSAATALVLTALTLQHAQGQGTGRPPQPPAAAAPAGAAEPYATVQRPAYVPQFDAQGRLIRPTGWREWPYMGTPVTPDGLNPPAANFPEFHNVYMDPVSWEHFKRTGEFRDGMVLVKELVRVQRNQTTNAANGSTAETSGRGFFMAEYAGLEAAVKDTRRFADQPGNWAYFSFGHVPEPQYMPATAPQAAATCNACHAVHAGRDFVFIQHYPVMRGAEAHVRR